MRGGLVGDETRSISGIWAWVRRRRVRWLGGCRGGVQRGDVRRAGHRRTARRIARGGGGLVRFSWRDFSERRRLKVLFNLLAQHPAVRRLRHGHRGRVEHDHQTIDCPLLQIAPFLSVPVVRGGYPRAACTSPQCQTNRSPRHHSFVRYQWEKVSAT